MVPNQAGLEQLQDPWGIPELHRGIIQPEGALFKPVALISYEA